MHSPLRSALDVVERELLSVERKLPGTSGEQGTDQQLRSRDQMPNFSALIVPPAILDGVALPPDRVSTISSVTDRFASKDACLDELKSNLHFFPDFLEALAAAVIESMSAVIDFENSRPVDIESIRTACWLVETAVDASKTWEVEERTYLESWLTIHRRILGGIESGNLGSKELPSSATMFGIINRMESELQSIFSTPVLKEVESIRQELSDASQIDSSKELGYQTTVSTVAERLNDSDRDVLQAVRELTSSDVKSITKALVAERSGVSGTTTRDTLAILVRFGLMDHGGSRVGYSLSRFGEHIATAIAIDAATSVVSD